MTTKTQRTLFLKAELTSYKFDVIFYIIFLLLCFLITLVTTLVYLCKKNLIFFSDFVKLIILKRYNCNSISSICSFNC